jgi:hypothetical protein
MAQDDTLIHYSSDGWTFTWNPPQGPIELSKAFTQGAYIGETRDNPTYTSISLLKGASVRTHNAAKTMAVAMTIDQNHPIHKKLVNLQAFDTDDGPRNVVGDLVGVLIGPNGAEVKKKTYVNAYIESQADETDDIASTQVTWTFRCNRVKKEYPENNSEIVGSS